jgi:uncharacterized protein (UPF0332 family)
LVENSLTEWNRAKDFLAAAKRNLEESDLRTAANRAYFSAERAVVACLMCRKIKIPKHHKVVWYMCNLLNINYDAYTLLRRLYDLRLQADYGKSSKIIELTNESLNQHIAEIEKMMEDMKIRFRMP